VLARHRAACAAASDTLPIAPPSAQSALPPPDSALAAPSDPGSSQPAVTSPTGRLPPTGPATPISRHGRTRPVHAASALASASHLPTPRPGLSSCTR
jgi:hypothetical protein